MAVILDAFSLSNFHTFGKRTFTIPKVLSSIKAFSEDIPQFIVQCIFILFFGKHGQSKTSIVVSIMLGVFSFILSIKHALHARTSLVDMKKVEDMIKIRWDNNHPDFQLVSDLDKMTLLKEFKENIDYQ